MDRRTDMSLNYSVILLMFWKCRENIIFLIVIVYFVKGKIVV
jgi:hypothetical protein